MYSTLRMDNFDAEALYGAIGERIRKSREGLPTRLSQAALAKKLNISRASIVNIRAAKMSVGSCTASAGPRAGTP